MALLVARKDNGVGRRAEVVRAAPTTGMPEPVGGVRSGNSAAPRSNMPDPESTMPHQSKTQRTAQPITILAPAQYRPPTLREEA